MNTTGRLCRYGAIRRENKMIFFGGKPSSLTSTNKMFEYCFEKRTFSLIEAKLNASNQNSEMPAMDSHSLSYHASTDQLVVFGGFLGAQCAYSNSLYTYSFATNEWTSVECSSSCNSTNIPKSSSDHSKNITNKIISTISNDNEHTKGESAKAELNEETSPPPRGSHGAALVNDDLYIYGGISGETIYEDLWRFSLTTKAWT